MFIIILNICVFLLKKFKLNNIIMKANHAPYVKKIENGILVNPITKDNPYLFGKLVIKRGFRIWQIVKNNFFKGKTIINL